MASFESINYVLRPNKSVERKLIFETFSRLEKTFDFSTYSYIGMGSMWFVDFVMAHKILGISSLISFEHPDYADRARFNCPYKAIDVRGEIVSEGVQRINWEQGAIVWLDYDTGPEGPAFSDVGYLSQKMSSGSFLMVTLNAHLGRIKAKDEKGNDITRHQGLRDQLGEFAPDESEFPNLNLKKYPYALAKSLSLCIEREARRSARGVEFYPFMNFKYSDNAPMITVGGVFLNESDKAKFLENNHVQNSEYLNKELFEINIPHLTQKERTVLDSLLPSDEKLTEAGFRAEFGFNISQQHLDGYSEFYKLYPVFGEVVL